jgi:Rad3-related DNA helicase
MPADAFPFAHYRAGQREALDAARRAFGEGRRIVVVEAPTGAGKSAIAVTLAREASSSYLLTGQKILQDQYQRDFDDLAVVKGRANYPCEVAATHAGDAPCLLGRTYPACSACSYFRAKHHAIASRRALLNYAYFLHELNASGQFGPRDLLVLDEAHNAEAMLLAFVTLTLADGVLERAGIDARVPGFVEGEVAFEFAERLIPRVAERVRALGRSIEAGSGSIEREAEILRQQRTLATIARRLDWLIDSRDDGVEWVVEHRFERPHGASLTFKPVSVAPFAEELLFAHARRVLMLSATVLDAGTFLRSLGVAPEEAAVVQVASTFPVERRPLLLRPVARLTRHHLEEELPRLIAEVIEIMRDHDGEKGVVHTHTYRIAEAIARALPADLAARVITHRDAAGRDAAIDAHLRAPSATILLSPSMTEGLDFVGDLARWQVICKLPYPSLGDPQVAARCRNDQGWYDWRTSLTLVQAYGRAVRSEEDHAVTYVLDAGAPKFLERQRRRLPGWFVDAIRPG